MAFGKNIKTWFDGKWHDGDVPVLKASDHAAWLGTMVFDGARTFEGVTPDLDLHCQRIVRSAHAMGMETFISAEEIEELIWDGVKSYSGEDDLYLRPMMWSSDGVPGLIPPDPTSTKFAIAIEDMPMADPEAPFALTESPFLRPVPEMALTDAKAGCHYANNGRILADAQRRGFNNALSLDINGNVAETASSNAFLVRDGDVFTPEKNGMFLAGITRARVIDLLKQDGIKVHETTLKISDFAEADEIFLTGNATKITPVTKFEDKLLPFGQVTRRARDLYWSYSHQTALERLSA